MSLYSAIAETFRTGKEMIAQSLSIATASGTIQTPYKSIDSVQITQNIGVAPGVAASVYTWTFAATGIVTIFAWMPTSNANPTLIASTGASVVSVTIVGRRR